VKPRDYALSIVGGFLLTLVALWLTSCGPQGQARKAAIEKAEDELCALRAAQKVTQSK
jgi:hypothetical protein